MFFVITCNHARYLLLLDWNLPDVVGHNFKLTPPLSLSIHKHYVLVVGQTSKNNCSAIIENVSSVVYDHDRDSTIFNFNICSLWVYETFAVAQVTSSIGKLHSNPVPAPPSPIQTLTRAIHSSTSLTARWGGEIDRDRFVAVHRSRLERALVSYWGSFIYMASLLAYYSACQINLYNGLYLTVYVKISLLWALSPEIGSKRSIV